MSNNKSFDRRRGVPAAVLLTALLVAPSASLHAQDAQGPQEPPVVAPSDMQGIGPPQLRRFELPGERVSPPPQSAPEPAPAPPPAAEATETPAAAAPAEASPMEAAAPQDGSVAEAAPRRPVASDRATSAPVGDAGPRTGSGVPSANSAQPGIVPPGPAVPVQPSNAQPTPGNSLFFWPYALAALLGGALVALALLLVGRRRRNGELAEYYAAAEQPAPEPMPAVAAPQPAPRPEPAPLPVAARTERPPTRMRPPPAPVSPAGMSVNNDVVGIQIRPWLQLQFKPDRAAATLTEAAVQYELLISNVGNAPARNIRVVARMFNAGAEQEKEIKDFFAKPVNGKDAGQMVAIPPRNATTFRSVVAMPKNEVREIEVEGRRLFIPMVAFNVFYEWGNGKTGQTSMSYLVGREPEAPSDKMGAFRLDLGPRVYRQIGQRPSQTAVLV